MKWLPETPQLLAVAEPIHFMAHLMTYGTPEDLRTLQDVVGIDDFREVLDNAPPGVFDKRSWAYWNLKCGRSPAPPMPTRLGLQPLRPAHPPPPSP